MDFMSSTKYDGYYNLAWISSFYLIIQPIYTKYIYIY